MKKAFSILLAILRHRVTYRFLAVVLTALGVTAATDTAGRLEVFICAILSNCS